MCEHGESISLEGNVYLTCQRKRVAVAIDTRSAATKHTEQVKCERVAAKTRLGCRDITRRVAVRPLVLGVRWMNL